MNKCLLCSDDISNIYNLCYDCNNHEVVHVTQAKFTYGFTNDQLAMYCNPTSTYKGGDRILYSKEELYRVAEMLHNPNDMNDPIKQGYETEKIRRDQIKKLINDKTKFIENVSGIIYDLLKKSNIVFDNDLRKYMNDSIITAYDNRNGETEFVIGMRLCNDIEKTYEKKAFMRKIEEINMQMELDRKMRILENKQRRLEADRLRKEIAEKKKIEDAKIKKDQKRLARMRIMTTPKVLRESRLETAQDEYRIKRAIKSEHKLVIKAEQQAEKKAAKVVKDEPKVEPIIELKVEPKTVTKRKAATKTAKTEPIVEPNAEPKVSTKPKTPTKTAKAATKIKPKTKPKAATIKAKPKIVTNEIK